MGLEKARRGEAVRVEPAAGHFGDGAGGIVELDLVVVVADGNPGHPAGRPRVVGPGGQLVGVEIELVFVFGGVAVAESVLEVGEPAPAVLAAAAGGAARQRGGRLVGGVRDDVHALEVERHARGRASTGSHRAQALADRRELPLVVGLVAALAGRFLARKLTNRGVDVVVVAEAKGIIGVAPIEPTKCRVHHVSAVVPEVGLHRVELVAGLVEVDTGFLNRVGGAGRKRRAVSIADGIAGRRAKCQRCVSHRQERDRNYWKSHGQLLPLFLLVMKRVDDGSGDSADSISEPPRRAWCPGAPGVLRRPSTCQPPHRSPALGRGSRPARGDVVSRRRLVNTRWAMYRRARR